jgi:acyl-CoA thioesterase I
MTSSTSCLGWIAAAFLTVSLAGPARAVEPMAERGDPIALAHVTQALSGGGTVVIAAFGSSSTEGVGASSPRASYPARLQVLLNSAAPNSRRFVVLNRGIGGEDADDMIRRLPKVIAEHPDLIIWQTGSNDLLLGVPLDRFVAETVAGIELIRAAGIDVMLMDPQLSPRLEGHKATKMVRDAMQKIGESMRVPVIGRYELMRGWLADHAITMKEMISPDGLHMADRGYSLLAQAVSADIQRRSGMKVLTAGK